MDRFRSLEAFVAVAEVGGLTRAARILGISKSAVSERLAALEQLVGERLLARTTRSVMLTDAGRALYEEYAPIVARLAELPSARAAVEDTAGRVRIAAMLDVGLHEIAAAVISARAEHPRLAIELVLSNEVVDPRAGGFDLAFHFRRFRTHAIKQEAIIDIPCGLYGSPSYIAEHGTPASPTDLGSHDCLGYSFQAGVDDWNTAAWTFSRKGERMRARVSLAMRSNSSTVLKAMAMGGHGLAVLPKPRARDAVASGQLVAVLEDWSLPALALYAVAARELQTAARIRAVVKAVRRQFDEVGG